MAKVKVWDGTEVVAAVEYNENLDRWNGSNWCDGSMGHHRGITRLMDGRYVLIHGTDYEGERDAGYIIPAKQALQEILQAGAESLLDEPKFAELKELREKSLVSEWEASEAK